MRILALMAAAFLLSGGLGSPALAGEVQVEVRPGLTVRAGDGYLSRAAEDKLYRARDNGHGREELEKLTAERPSYYPIFDLAGRVELEAENTEGATLLIFRAPLRPLAFHIALTPRNPVAANDVGAFYPVRVVLRIDDWAVEADSWGQRAVTRPAPVRVVLWPGWPMSGKDRERFQSEILEAILKGRQMTLETTLKNGETVSASFDLSGLDEALNLMEQKMAESDAVAKREIERLKKELAAMR